MNGEIEWTAFMRGFVFWETPQPEFGPPGPDATEGLAEWLAGFQGDSREMRREGYPLKPGHLMQVASRSGTDVPDLHRYELVKRQATLRFCPTYDCPALSW